MKTPLLLIPFLLLLHTSNYANMAQAFIEGTWSSSPFLHEEVDILQEKIWIKIEENLGAATFKIEYHIHARSEGIQIPFLFYAAEYLEGFNIWIDGEKIPLQRVPPGYQELEGSPFSGFDYFFEIKEYEGETYREVEIQDPHMESVSRPVDIRELKFFQVDIAKGNHVITAEYQANAGTSLRNWVKKYNYKYALAPARYWHSFGSLEIWMDGTDFPAGNLGSSLGNRIG